MPMEKPYDIVFDSGTGRPILVSPGRRERPFNTRPGDDHRELCPFCAGNENLTPEESDSVRHDGSPPGTPGWTVRTFENLYPATARHEVIAEGAEHTIHPAELGSGVLADSLAVYRRRILAAEERPEVECAFLFKNVGAAAGSSIAHNHSQLLGLPMLPPRLVSELSNSTRSGCIHCREIARAEAEGRVIHAGRHHVILSPSTPKLPFEAWLVPLNHDDDFFADTHDDDLVDTLKSLYTDLDRAFDGAPFNTFLHRVPNADFHWHIEIQPRVGQLAALELGGDMYINSVSTHHSVQRWTGGRVDG